MTYRVRGLAAEPFAPLFDLDDAALVRLGARRMVADSKPGFPCRVSLADAEPGEALILLNHDHMTVESSPYRAKGPIFVRENAASATHDDTLPPYLTTRLLSLRAYDAEGMMVDAEVVEGKNADPLIRRYLARQDVETVHAHFARRGCFGARIERA